MIYFFQPYSQEKDLGKAYNDYAKLVPNQDDWICFTDGDVMFLTPDFGHHLQEIIDLYPSTGLFTCISNRVGQKRQCFAQTISEEPNILHHRKLASSLSQQKRHQVSPIPNPISGQLMLVKKSTFDSVNGFPEGRGILSVDNTFSNRIVRNGYNILLMEGVYVFHFYRLDIGIHNKSHLL